ncbi:MAG TPA: hypothetical protein PK360_07565 [bacterium]|nr:hypothetical protein [bacterium]
MNNPLLLLSYPFPADGNIEGWFSTVSNWLRAFEDLAMETALEYAVERPGPGSTGPEQPTIEQIDRLLQMAAGAGCRFGSIHIPVDPAKSDENLGDEISTIDGWTDLASYAEFRAARISLAHPEALAQPGPRQFLQGILEYMDDMDLQAILNVTPASMTWVKEFLDQRAAQSKHPAGLGLPWEWIKENDGSKLPLSYLTAVRFVESQPLNAGGIACRYREIESRFGGTKPILVVELKQGDRT